MADAQPLDPSRIQANGWHQGAVCQLSTLATDDSSLLARAPNFAGSDALAILVSHDCDIVHRGVNEPVVEWVVAMPIAKNDSRCLYGRNPRQLHFVHLDTNYEVWARDRLTTTRALLERVSAETRLELPLKLTTLVTHWLSKRYIRSAFPDAFNDRLQPVQRDIRKALDDSHRFLRDLLIHVEPKCELAAEQIYHVSILGIMTGEDFKDAEQRESCQAVLKQLEIHLAQCGKVVVEDCELQSADSTPISVLDYYETWDFDYLSVRDSENAEVNGS